MCLSPIISKIYINDSYQFDGSLVLFDNLDDIARYELEISGSWGLIDRPYLVSGHKINFPSSNFKIPGNINLKLFVDGRPVEKMEHNITVVDSDPPIVEYDLKGSVAHFIIESFLCIC